MNTTYTIPDVEPVQKTRFCAPSEVAEPEPFEIVIAEAERDGAFMLTRFRRHSPDSWGASTLTPFLGWGPEEPIRRHDVQVARKVAEASRDCVFVGPSADADTIVRRIFAP